MIKTQYVRIRDAEDETHFINVAFTEEDKQTQVQILDGEAPEPVSRDLACTHTELIHLRVWLNLKFPREFDALTMYLPGEYMWETLLVMLASGFLKQRKRLKNVDTVRADMRKFRQSLERR